MKLMDCFFAPFVPKEVWLLTRGEYLFLVTDNLKLGFRFVGKGI